MMICKRCGTRCPPKKEGYCFHCLVATDIERALSEKAGEDITLTQAGVIEGFPDWEKPKKADRFGEDLLL
jgi:hypothetical protein